MPTENTTETEVVSFNKRIYALVRRIPAGKVATYGWVAATLGVPRGARAVGWALSALKANSETPWQRVVNASRQISPRGGLPIEGLQRALLEAEGVIFNGETIASQHLIRHEAELLP
jgi:methylated-DNA-protein-cysteine methyltransferase related protein